MGIRCARCGKKYLKKSNGKYIDGDWYCYDCYNIKQAEDDEKSRLKEEQIRVEAQRRLVQIEEERKMRESKTLEQLKQMREDLNHEITSISTTILDENMEKILNIIIDDELRTILSTTEITIQNLKISENELDFSQFLCGYRKFLERLLHEKVTVNFISKIRNDYPNGPPSSYLNGTIKNLRGILQNEESFPLGTWCFILDHLKDQFNPIENELIQIIVTNLPPRKREQIKNACALVNDECSPGVHKDVDGKTKVLRIREKIIPHLEKIVKIFYPTRRSANIINNTEHDLNRCLICRHEISQTANLYRCQSCGNFFHSDCILNWVYEGHKMCPYCSSFLRWVG